MPNLSITHVRSYWWGRIACHRNDDYTWTATAELGPQWPSLTHTYTALHEDKNTAIAAALRDMEAYIATLIGEMND